MAQEVDIAARTAIFRAVAPFFGQILPAAFFQKTSEFVPGIDRLHNLASGIFKPKDSAYALCISSTLSSPYHDQLNHSEDRSWWLHYSPKSGGMDQAANVSLIRCMENQQPVLVVKQVYDKHHERGSHYRLMGLGVVESFDAAAELFRIREHSLGDLGPGPGNVLPDDLVPAAIRMEALDEWTPFVAEDRAIYRVSRERRNAAFAGIVLENYAFRCAVTGTGYHSERHIEAQGAHIISRAVRGTDDPRNGIALSRTAHWAFDRGLFTISDQYEVEVHPKARDARIANLSLFELDRQKISLPADKIYWPHQEALAWHRERIFDRFEL